MDKEEELINWLSNNLFHKDFENKQRELNLLIMKRDSSKIYHSPSDRIRIGKEFKL